MATYPNTQLNLGQTSPDTRNETYTGEGLYVFDREQTSFLALFDMAKTFVQNKNDASTFRDFYAGSVGSTLIELASGFSEFNSYSSIVARRESYLSEARLLDSSIGIAESLGYSTYRGENPKFTVTFTPTTDLSIKKFDIVGTVGAYDVISLEDKDIAYGEETDLQIVIGTLKIAGITINDAKTYDFRFAQDKISEDIQLQLDGEIVPISNILYDLLVDNFVVLSNPVGGIDVRYLNRSQPDNWIQYNRYTFLNYVLPKYDWRPGWTYEIGDIVSQTSEIDALPILYVCTNKGTSAKKEPYWNEVTNSFTQESNLAIRWQCLGRINKQYFFRNSTPGISISGLDEPIWLHATKIGETEDHIGVWQLNPLGQQVEDGNLTWICTDNYEYSKYFYNTGSILQLTYVELEDLAFDKKSIQLDIGPISNISVENEYKAPENLQEIKRNAPLYNETRYVIRGREDYRKIFQILLTNCVDTNGFDPIPAVVELTYVKDHTNRVWTPDTYYQTGDEVMSTDGNGFIYRAITSGYSGISKRGKSGLHMPIFFNDINVEITDSTPETEGEIIPYLSPVYDNNLIWYPRYLGSRAKPILIWSADTEYNLHDEIVSAHPQVYFTVDKIEIEPVWPTLKMSDATSDDISTYSVQDNKVTWICIDDMYFNGYDWEYWKQDHVFEKGTFVKPVVDNGYFYLCTKAGMSGIKEPNWPIVICETIHDGGEDGCEWQCYDRVDAIKYIKNNALEELSKYRQYGVSPCVITDPRLVMVKVLFNLTTNKNIDNVTIQNDLFKIVDKYQRKLNTFVDTRTLEEAIEELDYIMIARATITGNNKVQEYEEGHLYRVKDVVKVYSSPYYYVANRIETGGYGYSHWNDQAYSGYTEPEWHNASIGSTFKDGKLTWQLKNVNELEVPLSSFWEPDSVYKIGMAVYPTQVENPTFYCQVISVEATNLNWPTKVGTSILDGRIYWTCVDPEKTAVPLGWDEYYMFDFSFTNERFYKK